MKPAGKTVDELKLPVVTGPEEEGGSVAAIATSLESEQILVGREQGVEVGRGIPRQPGILEARGGSHWNFGCIHVAAMVSHLSPPPGVTQGVVPKLELMVPRG